MFYGSNCALGRPGETPFELNVTSREVSAWEPQFKRYRGYSVLQ